MLLLLGRTFFAGKTEITYQLELKMVFTIKLIMVAVVAITGPLRVQVAATHVGALTRKTQKRNVIKPMGVAHAAPVTMTPKI